MTIELNVYNLEGKQESEKIKVKKEIFATKVNEDLLYTYANWYLANKRAGSADTKTRAEVRGGGKKPYRQKGTGSARRGSSRSPLLVGGGVIFGPKPRSFSFKMNKKMREAALCSALSSKKENLIIIKSMVLKEPKTKEMIKVINNFDLKENVLFVDEKLDENFCRAARNIKFVKVENIKKLNAYDLIKHNKVFITVAAVKKIEEKIKQ